MTTLASLDDYTRKISEIATSPASPEARRGGLLALADQIDGCAWRDQNAASVVESAARAAAAAQDTTADDLACLTAAVIEGWASLSERT